MQLAHLGMRRQMVESLVELLCHLVMSSTMAQPQALISKKGAMHSRPRYAESSTRTFHVSRILNTTVQPTHGSARSPSDNHTPRSHDRNTATMLMTHHLTCICSHYCTTNNPAMCGTNLLSGMSSAGCGTL